MEHLDGEPGIAMIIKQRAAASKIERMDLVGNVQGKDCVIVDDMCDTAGTLCAAAKMLEEHGALRVFSFITHGVLSGPAAERISASVLDELVFSNTIPLPPGLTDSPKVKQLSLAPLIAEAMKAAVSSASMTE